MSENIGIELKKNVKDTQNITILIRDYVNSLIADKSDDKIIENAKFAEKFCLATLYLSIARYEVYLNKDQFIQSIEDDFVKANNYFKEIDDELNKKSDDDQKEIINILDKYTHMYK